MPGILLPSHSERAARQQHKQRAALLFLTRTVYSTAANLAQVMGLKALPPAYRTLHAMERQELITHADLDRYGMIRIGLYGITSHGQAVAQAEAGAPPNDRYFVPSRVPLTHLSHFLELQRLQILAMRAGWSEWSYPDIEEEAYQKGAYRPDALARDRAGIRWAIEYERTLKTPGRYPEILAAHLKATKAGKADRVVWVCDTQARMEHLKKTILSIAMVPLAKDANGKPSNFKAVEPRHQTRLFFATAEQFPAVLQEPK